MEKVSLCVSEWETSKGTGSKGVIERRSWEGVPQLLG